MQRAWILRCALVVGAAAAVGVPTTVVGREDPASRRFEIVVDSHGELTRSGRSVTRSFDDIVKLTYDLTPRSRAVDISFHSRDYEQKVGGKATAEFHENRAGIREKQGVQERVVAYDQAPPALRKLLDEYDRPVVTIALDAEGSETGRTLKVDKKLLLVMNSMIDQARIFHVRFPEATDRWQAPAKISMAAGQHARGTLTYQKAAPAAAEGPVRVKVSGELQAAGKMGAGEIKDGIYKVSGEQVYDPAGREWASGVLDIVVELNIDVQADGKPVASGSITMSGTMKVTLRQLPPAATPAPK